MAVTSSSEFHRAITIFWFCRWRQAQMQEFLFWIIFPGGSADTRIPDAQPCLEIQPTSPAGITDPRDLGQATGVTAYRSDRTTFGGKPPESRRVGFLGATAYLLCVRIKCKRA